MQGDGRLVASGKLDKPRYTGLFDAFSKIKAAEGMEVIDVLEAHKDDDAAVAPGSVNFRGWMSVNLVGPTVGV